MATQLALSCRNTKTVGITSLGLEHTSILGDTLTDIAWQKAGIIKEHSDVFTVAQPDECMEVIRQRCAERKVSKNCSITLTVIVSPNLNLTRVK